DGSARSAGFAASLQHRDILAGNDACLVAAVADAPYETALDLCTGTHTARAQDALVEINAYEWVGIAIGQKARLRGRIGEISRRNDSSTVEARIRAWQRWACRFPHIGSRAFRAPVCEFL